MAKTCKFCNYDNDEEKEFCEQCGAKLPVFHHLAVDLDARTPKKHLKINFLLVFLIIFIMFIGYCVFLMFYPFLPDDELEDYNKTIQGTRRIISSIRHIPEDIESFSVSLYVLPDDLSMYLTSLAKPSILEREKFDDEVIPRLLVKFAPGNPKEFSLIHRSKFHGLNTRAEFVFKQYENDDTWFVDSCRLGRFPMTWFNQFMLSSVLEDYTRHPDMRKILKSRLDLRRNKSYVDISLKYNKKDVLGKIGGFFSNLFSKARDVGRRGE